MIEGLAVSVENLGKVESLEALIEPITGWYYDSSIGQWYYLYIDEAGIVHRYYRALGVEALGFVPREVYPATNIRPDAPINVVEGDTIRVGYSFKYMGDAGSVTIQVGNAYKLSGVSVWDRGETAEVTRNLTKSTTPQPYTGSIDFVYGTWLQPKPDLFVLLHGQEYEVVYTNAFKKVVAEFTELKITSYAKV